MGDVHTQLRDILAATADAMDNPPDRRYVSPGIPALDCGQLTIHLAAIGRGTTSQERPTFPGAPVTVTAVVTWVHCITTMSESGRAPRTAALAADGRTYTEGGVELYKATCAAALLVASCRPAVDFAEPIDPSGGFAGWQVPVRWTI